MNAPCCQIVRLFVILICGLISFRFFFSYCFFYTFSRYFLFSFAIIINSESNFLQIGIIFIGLIRLPILYRLDDICEPETNKIQKTNSYYLHRKIQEWALFSLPKENHSLIIGLFSSSLAFIRNRNEGEKGDEKNRDLSKRKGNKNNRKIVESG